MHIWNCRFGKIVVVQISMYFYEILTLQKNSQNIYKIHMSSQLKFCILYLYISVQTYFLSTIPTGFSSSNPDTLNREDMNVKRPVFHLAGSNCLMYHSYIPIHFFIYLFGQRCSFSLPYGPYLSLTFCNFIYIPLWFWGQHMVLIAPAPFHHASILLLLLELLHWGHQ